MYISGWLRQQFNGKGGVARRAKADVSRNGGRMQLLEMVKVHDWHLVETGTHYIVIYDAGFLKFWR